MNTRSFPRCDPARGFTLIELMVALAIGLLMAFGLVRVFASSSDSYRALSQASQQIENGRYAIQSITEDLKHAGFYGEFAFPAAAGAALPNPCEIANMVNIRDALPFHVQGYSNVAVSPIACIDNANIVAGTDVLVIRRSNTGAAVEAANQAAIPALLVAGEIYMQANFESTNPANPVIGLGSSAPADWVLTKKGGVAPSPIRKYHVVVYFVSPCSETVGGVCTAASDGGRPVPTLKRLTLGVDPATNVLAMRTEAIAEGIENFQVDYGVDADGDGLPDGAFVAAPGAVAAWGDVMSAQIYVLARTPEMTGGADPKTYNLGTAGALTPGGSFRRHLFTSQVRMVNPASRREQP